MISHKDILYINTEKYPKLTHVDQFLPVIIEQTAEQSLKTWGSTAEKIGSKTTKDKDLRYTTLF